MEMLNLRPRYQDLIVFTLAILLIASCNTSVGSIFTPAVTPVGTTIVPLPTMPPSLVPVVNTPMPPLIPTLTAEQERTFVLDMLANNGGCELPCWWGIKPAVATLQTLRDRFGRPFKKGLPRQDGTTLYEAYYDLLNSAGVVGYYVNLGFVEQDGIIRAIEVDSAIHAGMETGYLSQGWQLYSIDQVLTQYGVPSRVQLQLVPPIELGAHPAYALTVVYEGHGFWIRYEGPATYDIKKAIVHACPSFAEVDHVKLRLQSTTIPTSTPLFRPDPDGFDRSLEEATGMSLKAFFENFKDTSKQTCLEGAPTSP